MRAGNVILVAVASGPALIASAPADAFPIFGESWEGNCHLCHTDAQSGRMELFDFAGEVDPDEAPGLPDPGPLKYFTVEQGAAAPLNIRGLNGADQYAYQLKGLEDPDVTALGVLVYNPDPIWDQYDIQWLGYYYCRSDGPRDGYDWGTGDPTEAPFALAVNEATNPGFYLVTAALVGTERNQPDWHQQERFYIEVTANPEVIALQAGELIRGQPARLTANNATPGAMVYFVYSMRGVGRTPVPPLGVTLALAAPALAGQARADAAGRATFAAIVPPQAPAIPFWLQAAQPGRVSNLVATEIR